jgi:hypothetical protein
VTYIYKGLISGVVRDEQCTGLGEGPFWGRYSRSSRARG